MPQRCCYSTCRSRLKAISSKEVLTVLWWPSHTYNVAAEGCWGVGSAYSASSCIVRVPSCLLAGQILCTCMTHGLSDPVHLHDPCSPVQHSALVLLTHPAPCRCCLRGIRVHNVKFLFSFYPIAKYAAVAINTTANKWTQFQQHNRAMPSLPWSNCNSFGKQALYCNWS